MYVAIIMMGWTMTDVSHSPATSHFLSRLPAVYGSRAAICTRTVDIQKGRRYVTSVRPVPILDYIALNTIYTCSTAYLALLTVAAGKIGCVDLGLELPRAQSQQGPCCIRSMACTMGC